MKNFITKQDLIVKEHNFTEKELDRIYHIARTVFQQKKNLSAIDTIIYNIIRCKPVFQGIEKLRQEKLYTYYINCENQISYLSDFSAVTTTGASYILETLYKTKKEQKILLELFNILLNIFKITEKTKGNNQNEYI